MGCDGWMFYVRACAQGAIATVLFCGGLFVIQGKMTVGSLASFLMYHHLRQIIVSYRGRLP